MAQKISVRLKTRVDNPYRDPVPGYHVRAEYPNYFASLTRVPVPFYYRSRDAELLSEKPLSQRFALMVRDSRFHL
jgi:hypothetical protein